MSQSFAPPYFRHFAFQGECLVGVGEGLLVLSQSRVRCTSIAVASVIHGTGVARSCVHSHCVFVALHAEETVPFHPILFRSFQGSFSAAIRWIARTRPLLRPILCFFLRVFRSEQLCEAVHVELFAARLRHRCWNDATVIGTKRRFIRLSLLFIGFDPGSRFPFHPFKPPDVSSAKTKRLANVDGCDGRRPRRKRREKCTTTCGGMHADRKEGGRRRRRGREGVWERAHPSEQDAIEKRVAQVRPVVLVCPLQRCVSIASATKACRFEVVMSTCWHDCENKRRNGAFEPSCGQVSWPGTTFSPSTYDARHALHRHVSFRLPPTSFTSHSRRFDATLPPLHHVRAFLRLHWSVPSLRHPPRHPRAL